jgi:hypothetical protein
MNSHFYLERRTTNTTEVISLGVLSNSTFWPTMPNEVFKILVKESKFRIRDENGNEFTYEEFHTETHHTFNNSPPVISLNSLP